MARTLSLTPQHILRVHRVMEDCGPPAGAQLQTDADYDEWVKRMVESHPAPDRSTRLFAYGSLIWKPEIEHVGETVGTARGWHRAFCYRVPRYRGTPEQPTLMMALERGGKCRGVVFDLPEGRLDEQLHRLFRREFSFKPANTVPRWVVAETENGKVAALTFVINRQSPMYAGRLALEEVADVLARACGHWGSAAEYLMNTVAHLEEHGIRDRNLWTLQKLVAARIDAA